MIPTTRKQIITALTAWIITIPCPSQATFENVVRLLKDAQVVCYAAVVGFSVVGLLLAPELSRQKNIETNAQVISTLNENYINASEIVERLRIEQEYCQKTLRAAVFTQKASIACACLLATTWLLKLIEKPTNSV